MIIRISIYQFNDFSTWCTGRDSFPTFLLPFQTNIIEEIFQYSNNLIKIPDELTCG